MMMMMVMMIMVVVVVVVMMMMMMMMMKIMYRRLRQFSTALANHKGHRQSNEPMKYQRKYRL